MKIWRVSNHADLAGTGGLRAAARWHSAGRAIVYCAPDPATALLETLVHQRLAAADLPETYQLLEINVSRAVRRRRIRLSQLPGNWQQDEAKTRALGDSWLRSNTTPLLLVPSVVVPRTWNVLINPRHPDAARLVIVSKQAYPYDERLR